jgi:hypothetical protein
MDWSQLGFTSGRRTYRGNKLVGGVANSDHLKGSAADFTAPLSALRKMFPSNPILDEGDHRHVSGLSNVPYHGRQGTAGLVNGIDTTAPKGNAMQQPMNRSPVRRNPILEAMSRPINGMDPLAPTSSMPVNPIAAQPNFAAMSQPQGGQDPLAPQQNKKGSIVGLILGALGDAALGYAGRPGVYAPMMMQQRDQEAEDNRFQQRLAAAVEQRRQEALAKAAEPIEHTNSAGDVVRINPVTRAQEVVYFDPYGKPRSESRVNPATGALEIFNTGSTPRPEADDIDDLRRDPSLARDFDAEFGPGAAAYFLRMGGR